MRNHQFCKLEHNGFLIYVVHKFVLFSSLNQKFFQVQHFFLLLSTTTLQRNEHYITKHHQTLIDIITKQFSANSRRRKTDCRQCSFKLFLHYFSIFASFRLFFCSTDVHRSMLQNLSFPLTISKCKSIFIWELFLGR